jgi:hypothetical protein
MWPRRKHTTNTHPGTKISAKIPIHIERRSDILTLYPRKAEKVFSAANELSTAVFLKRPPYDLLHHEMVLIDYFM